MPGREEVVPSVPGSHFLHPVMNMNHYRFDIVEGEMERGEREGGKEGGREEGKGRGRRREGEITERERF